MTKTLNHRNDYTNRCTNNNCLTRSEGHTFSFAGGTAGDLTAVVALLEASPERPGFTEVVASTSGGLDCSVFVITLAKSDWGLLASGAMFESEPVLLCPGLPFSPLEPSDTFLYESSEIREVINLTPNVTQIV